MQKFGLLFLAVSVALLGHLAPVGGVALQDRETNAERFARGLPPLAPRAPSPGEGAIHPRTSKRALTPVEGREPHPSKRAMVDVEKRHATPSKRATVDVGKRHDAKPSKRATSADVEKRHDAKPSKRATPVNAEKRHDAKPSKRATSVNAQKRHDAKPSKRATSVNAEKRHDLKPSKRATPVNAEKRHDSKPSKRATSVNAEKRHDLKPSKRATPVNAEKRHDAQPSKRATPVDISQRHDAKPSKRATPATPEKRHDAQPSKRAEAEVFHAQHWQLTSGRLEVRWGCNDSIIGYVANNPTGGSFGLNRDMLPGEDDLYVEYFDSNLMIMNPEMPPPYFVGGGDSATSVHDCSDKIRFGTVELGSSSAVWTLDPMSGALSATLTNKDGSEDKPFLVYDPTHNVLGFTHEVNHNQHPVTIYLSD